MAIGLIVRITSGMLLRQALALIAVVGLSGCPTIQGPGYLHPGSAAQQQNQAQRFDPYPATDVGPDMAARPLAYIRPAPENERVQNVDSFMKRYRQPPPIDQYRPPRTNVAAPPPGFVPVVPPGSTPVVVP
jgi:hypothetical protein